MNTKQIKLVASDGEIVLNQETSEAIFLYAKIKGFTIDQAVEEVLKGFISKFKENQSSSKSE